MTLKILTIDDDPQATTLTSLLLGGFGMEVLVANSGKIGVQMVRDESPDVVMLDMMMPEMDGIAACQAIRSFSQVPILVYSAFYDSDEIVKVKTAGANDYLMKPTPGMVIIEHIKKLVPPEK